MKNTLLASILLILASCGSSDGTPGSSGIANPALTKEGNLKSHLISGYKLGLEQTTFETGIITNRNTNQQVCDYQMKTTSTLIAISGDRYSFHVLEEGNPNCTASLTESIEIYAKDFYGSIIDTLLKNILDQGATYDWNPSSKEFSMSKDGLREAFNLQTVTTHEMLYNTLSEEGSYETDEYEVSYTVSDFQTRVIAGPFDVEGLKDSLGYCLFKSQEDLECFSPKN
ncbi:hypothetical protein [Halobacteriovorax sp. JY17]|uniref:hypothetical protein n=1 Tax=Halobacteriovorax sp. JY17 TaxID=2014617 RepID=UPI000C5AAE21|nr:hypothetical protein [Halobacteriovorax sp. JY17]PIK14207.1 MAG: hypothetical protein CES88_14615 [Halobacteriovorax sp. JY17]